MCRSGYWLHFTLSSALKYPFRLDHIVTQDQYVEAGIPKSIDCLLGRANDRLTFYVERRVDNDRQAREVFERFQ